MLNCIEFKTTKTWTVMLFLVTEGPCWWRMLSLKKLCCGISAKLKRSWDCVAAHGSYRWRASWWFTWRRLLFSAILVTYLMHIFNLYLVLSFFLLMVIFVIAVSVLQVLGEVRERGGSDANVGDNLAWSSLCEYSMSFAVIHKVNTLPFLW